MWWPSVTDTVSIHDTLGVFLLATLIAGGWYGITVLQGVQYVDRFYNDPSGLKFLVFILWAFETINMIMEAYALYFYAVANNGFKLAAIAFPWSLQVERAFSYLTVYAVQMFYMMRIRELGRLYWYLPVVIGSVATGAVATGLATTIEAAKYSANDSKWPTFVDSLSSTSVGLQIATDVIITVSLYWLNRYRVGNMKTRPFVKYVLVSAVNRGVFSALLQIITTATYFALRPRLVWVAFHMSSSKVHVMSVLSTLNTRSALDGVGHDPEIVDAKLRYRVQRELGDPNGEFESRTDTPPIIPNVVPGIISRQSSWFASKSEEGGLGKSYVPSYHAHSTTAVDNQSVRN